MSRVIVEMVADVWYSTPHEKKITQQEGEKARRKEHDMVLDYKLVPFGSSAVSKRGYRAVVDNDGFVRDTDDILIETADRFGIKPPQLKMCIRRALRRKWAARSGTGLP